MAGISRLNISAIPPGSAGSRNCGDVFLIEQLIQPGCSDHYCKTCFVDLFAYQASSLPEFPPECCGIVLHPHDYLSILPDYIISDWVRLSKIHRETTRIACATPKCHGPGIDPITIHNDWGLCERCHQLTCTRCGQLQSAHLQPGNHTGTASNAEDETVQDIVSTTAPTTVTTQPNPLTIPTSIQQASLPTRTCPAPIIDQAFEQVASQNGWKRCPACNVPIERIAGCPEMICMCGEVFCYDCGKAREREHGCMCQDHLDL